MGNYSSVTDTLHDDNTMAYLNKFFDKTSSYTLYSDVYSLMNIN